MVNKHRREKIEKARECWNYCATHYSDKDVFESVMNSDALVFNPYHNNYHTACMIVNAFEAFQYYEQEPVSGYLEQQNYKARLYKLLLACLYHDYDHTAGSMPDAINIMKATQGLFSTHMGYYDVAKIIAVTEFPFIRQPETLEEKIIRDCDLMQMLEPDWFDQIFVGLYTELLNNPKFADLTPEKFVQMQIAFLEGAQFYTEWFEKTRRKKWNAAIKLAKGVKV